MKRRLPSTLHPVPAVVLAIDSAKKSGAAIMARRADAIPNSAGDELVAVEVLELNSNPAGMLALAQRAMALEAKLGVPLVVVRETWRVRNPRAAGPHGQNVRTMTGIGASWGRWESCLVLAGHKKRRIVSVDTGTWRARIFGGRRGRSEQMKEWACNYARGRFGLELGHNAAEAVCIGAWGFHSGHVLELIPKKVRKAHGMEQL